jgi:hypothetical protein
MRRLESGWFDVLKRTHPSLLAAPRHNLLSGSSGGRTAVARFLGVDNFARIPPQDGISANGKIGAQAFAPYPIPAQRSGADS